MNKKEKDDLKKQREKEYKLLKKDWKADDAAICERFGPGGFGYHEYTERAHLMSMMWNEFMLEHASVCLDEKLYLRANEIMDKICDFYQMVAVAGD